MSYATTADMVLRFGQTEVQQLTDRELPALGLVDEAVLQRALADADAVIDSHLGGRYATPLATPLPADIVRIACDLTRYFLHDMSAPELVRDRFDDAQRWLRDVAQGKVALIAAGGALVGVKTNGTLGSAVAGYPDGATFGAAFARAWAAA